MASLATTYMGIEIKNPLVMAASSLSNKVDKVKEVEAAGAGALVIRSLFEEQILQEEQALDDALQVGSDAFGESLSYFPNVQHSGAREHVMWVEKTRQAVSMPLIASLNAVNPGSWTDFARQLAETGVNGLELNVYAVEASLERNGGDVEKRLVETVAAVVQTAGIPVAVKLSPFYTSTGSVVQQLEQAGAQAVVLFNRFFQPDIDIKTLDTRNRMTWSTAAEMRLPLRWIGLLYAKVGIDLCGNTGVEGGEEVIKYLLAGATAVQTAAAVIRKGTGHITVMVSELERWMDEHGFASIEDFRGKCSQAGLSTDPYVYERAQYVQLLTTVNR